MSAFETQVSGTHYSKLAIQPMQYSMANKLDACQHTIIKYVTRFRDKGKLADLEKARHVLDMLIELEYGSKSENAEKHAELGDGWIQWNGGECPVPARTRVEIRFRRGGNESNRIAEALEWEHGKLGWWWDIVAYRIVNPAT